MVNLERISIISVTKFGTIFGIILGLLFGLIISLLTLLKVNIYIFSSYGFESLIIFPITYGIIGVLFGLICVPLVNLVLKITKGVELKFLEE